MPDEFTTQSVLPIERRLATILCADVAGYSKMMADNEELTVSVFRGHREIFESLVNLHHGRIFNTAGDALLAEFNSPVEAVRCATEIQAALGTRNEHLAPDAKMLFRMGINLGDVIIQGEDLLGDGVNIAARIQTATAPGGICISGSVYDQIQNKLSLDFKLLGEQTYKNIAKPVRTYTVNEGTVAVTPVRRKGWRMLAAFTTAVLTIAGAVYWGYQQYDAYRIEQLRANNRLSAQMAAQKQAIENARQAAEEAKKEMQLQAQKLASEEELRQAQAERNRVEEDRKLIEAEKRAAEAAKRRAADESLRRAQEERAQLEQERKMLNAEKAAVEAAKRQAADELLRRAQEERAQLEQKHKQIEAEKLTTASRHAAATAAKDAPKFGTLHDGTYGGRLCNLFTRPGENAPACWRAKLEVRNGIVEGTWLSKSQQTSKAHGTIADDGSVNLTLEGWTPTGSPVKAILIGRITDGVITVSGQWSQGNKITGNWKRQQ